MDIQRTTKPYAPFELIYEKFAGERKEARKREKYWKFGIGKEKLREISSQFNHS